MSPTPRQTRSIIVAGHICLDLTPTFPLQTSLPAPGELAEVGTLAFSLGGAVANTGGALARLGVPVTMLARVGNDFLGERVGSLASKTGATVHLFTDLELYTSYSVVIAPAHVDRCFLHSPGANHAFDPAQVTEELLGTAQALHFGYPPAMRSTYADGGAGIASMFARARDAGLMTSLDLCSPDMSGPCGRVNWREWLARVLPFVSLFCPSLDELQVLLGRRPLRSAADLDHLATELLKLGCSAILIKLGSEGLYFRSGSRTDSFLQADGWSNRQLHSPCFAADVVTANGAGDCTIAGLLASITSGHSPETALQHACAVGACNVEAADASSGIKPWAQTLARIAAGWPRASTSLLFSDFTPTIAGCLAGPSDRRTFNLELK